MIIHNCAQHGAEWEKLRLGIPTSSEFSKIVTPSREPSKQWRAYAYRLIAERLLQAPLEHYTSGPMERGQIVEAEAVDWYEFDQGASVQKVGFITDDDKTMGCSPDRLIGDDGLLEVKCPLPHVQVEYILTGRAPRHYLPQLQGQLMITGREWVDILCWHDVLPRTVVRVPRNDGFIKLLASEIRQFNAYINEIMECFVSGQAAAQPALKEMLRASLEAKT